ncbi:SDR family oxidoreductase [Notoacmeibacter marinus]|uniref:SDR family oxidoreductase n=1 Tax=Notoacmeibacter marinus TaxID=1876515 RepID=UPI000DF2E6B0|nr:SDR family oxidoreductase [Notoacmeibacter marinus]
MQLEGKIALVTGATTGIGNATARQFLNEGVAGLVITGQNEKRLAATKQELAGLGKGTVSAVRYRAEEIADSQAVADVLKREHGLLDVVFANAGVTWPAPFGQIDADEAQRQFLVNTTAPLILAQALTPLMGSGGSVIFNTSCLEVLGMSGMAVYSASKAALRSIVRTLAYELKAEGIRVNAVAPGPTETPIYSKLGMTDEQLGEMADGMKQIVPAGRFGTPDEIAGAVTFLASDASRYMLGEQIYVDGGWANL